MTMANSQTGVPKLGLILPEGENDMDGRTAVWADYVAMAGRPSEGSWAP